MILICQIHICKQKRLKSLCYYIVRWFPNLDVNLHLPLLWNSVPRSSVSLPHNPCASQQSALILTLLLDIVTPLCYWNYSLYWNYLVCTRWRPLISLGEKPLAALADFTARLGYSQNILLNPVLQWKHLDQTDCWPLRWMEPETQVTVSVYS